MSTYGSDRFLGASRIGSSLEMGVGGRFRVVCEGFSDWTFLSRVAYSPELIGLSRREPTL